MNFGFFQGEKMVSHTLQITRTTEKAEAHEAA